MNDSYDPNADPALQEILGDFGKPVKPNGHAPPDPRDIPFQQFSELKLDTSRVALIGGLIGGNSFAVIYGGFGCSKTAYAIHMGICIASATEFFGMAVEQTGVLYIAAEAPELTNDRILAYRMRGTDPSIPFFLVTVPINLGHDFEVPSLIALIAKIEKQCDTKIGVVFIDTLS